MEALSGFRQKLTTNDINAVHVLQLIILPAVEELQVDPVTRGKWIDYSAYDAKATWQLAQCLRKALQVNTYVLLFFS